MKSFLEAQLRQLDTERDDTRPSAVPPPPRPPRSTPGARPRPDSRRDGAESLAGRRVGTKILGQFLALGSVGLMVLFAKYALDAGEPIVAGLAIGAPSVSPAGLRVKRVAVIVREIREFHVSPSRKASFMADNDLGSLLSGLLGNSGNGASGNVLGSLLEAFGGGNGNKGGNGGNPLAALLDMLAKSGLADQAQSWVGTGQNQPVTGEQIAEALPDAALQKVSEEAGVSPRQAADEIASTLPRTVDKLTPEGRAPAGTSLEDLIKQMSV